MFATCSESTTIVGEPCADPIHLVTQFYLDKNAQRLKEVRNCLRLNIVNPSVDSITLLNERLYSLQELGLTVPSPKVRQIVIERRALFSDLLTIRQPGYTVVCNADIFFDTSLGRVRRSDLHVRKAAYALLRYEYREGMHLNDCKLYGPRADSQDTWIVHSNFPVPSKMLNIELGRPGCDNRLAYVLQLCGYKMYNDPFFVRTYHFHESADRPYYTDGTQAVPSPYLHVFPIIHTPFEQESYSTLVRTYDLMAGNDLLRNYLKGRTARFVIPRIAGIENVTAHAAVLGKALVPAQHQMLKNNTGVALEGCEADYAEKYWDAFERCDLYASWEPWAAFSNHLGDSQPYVKTKYPKPQFNSYVFDVFHFVASGAPWTHGLAGRRLLIVSPFAEQIRLREGVRPYPIDLFPDCSFEYLTPPMTQGSEPNRGWATEFSELCASVAKLDFDVALCSCGGYGNPLCAFIHSIGKSAIYVGGVLQMYFGIYGTRWLKERKDVMTLYLNERWTRPSSRPTGFDTIEGGCYW
jgi:hypothetical protein